MAEETNKTNISLPVVQAIQATSILSLILFMKVVVVNVGLGGAKYKAGTRAPEDTYQMNKEGVPPDAQEIQDRVQRIVNNDLENIPYTMALSWCSLFCIYLSSSSAASGGGNNATTTTTVTTTDKLAMTHIALYATFVVCRIGHSLSYSYGYSMTRSLVWSMGILCSFGLAINGCIASFRI